MQPNQPQQNFGPMPNQPQMPPQQGMQGGFPPQGGQPFPQKKSSMTIIIIIIAAVIIVAAGAIIAVLLMGGNNDDDTTSNNNNNGGSIVVPDDDEDEDDGSWRGLSEGVILEKSLSDVFKDSPLGHTITLKSAQINLPFDTEWSGERNGGVAIEVELRNEPTDISGIIGLSNFDLMIGSGRCSRTSFDFNDYAETEGMEVLPFSVGRNETATGWIFFSCSREFTGDMTLVYTRPETNVIFGDVDRLPEFKVEAKIQ